MALEESLARDWARQVAARPFHRALALVGDGLVLGAGTVLAAARGAAGLDLNRDGDLAVEGTGRKVKYLFAERGAADSAIKLLEERKNIEVFHFPPVTPVLGGRTRKGSGYEGSEAWHSS